MEQSVTGNRSQERRQTGGVLSGHLVYRRLYMVAQNKPDYLLLLCMSKSCISTTKYEYDNGRVAPRTLVQTLLIVFSTGCNNERQSLLKLSYSAIDNVLTNLLPLGLQDFFQVLNVSNATTTLSAANFLVPQILTH